MKNTIPYSKVSGATTSIGYVLYNSTAGQGKALYSIAINCTDSFTADIITYTGSHKGITISDFIVPAGGMEFTSGDTIVSMITTSATTAPITIVGSELV